MEIFEIIPGMLWQSSSIDSWDNLQTLGINSVIDLEGDQDKYIPGAGIIYTYWPIEDGGLPDLKALDIIVDFGIAQIRLGRKLLVHCAAGINRSSLVDALIVIKMMGMKGNTAVDYIRSHRPGALSNGNFESYIRMQQ